VGLPDVPELIKEIHGYWSVLLGHEDPPVDSPYLSLMEVAVAYYSRALEIDALIHEGEATKAISKNAPHYKFRVGPLRSFIDAARKHCDLGSRRLSQEDLLSRQRYDSGI